VVQERAPEPDDSDRCAGVGGEFRAVPVTDAKAVKSVVEKFREKYGAKDVKKYYSKFDVRLWWNWCNQEFSKLNRATNRKAYAV
jgi:hypothetical protein